MFLNIVTEEKFLHQIHLEEQFGSSTKLDAARDKKKSSNNVAIGYNYETEEPIPETVKSMDTVVSDEKGDDEDSDIDLGTRRTSKATVTVLCAEYIMHYKLNLSL